MEQVYITPIIAQPYTIELVPMGVSDIESVESFIKFFDLMLTYHPFVTFAIIVFIPILLTASFKAGNYIGVNMYNKYHEKYTA